MNKTYILPIILIIGLAFAISHSIGPVNILSHQTNTASLKYHATVCEYYKKAGTDTWQLIGCNHNTLTDIGKNFIRDQLTNPDNTKILKYISLATDPSDCSSSATNLASEITSNGLERHECSLTNGTGYGNWTCEYLFTATGSVSDVQVAGYHWDSTSASDNNLFACASFGSVDMEANDQIKIIWTVTVSES